MKKIVLVSPFPPAQNPRLYKEYLALKDAKFDVKVIYAVRDPWADGLLIDDNFFRVAGKNGSFLHFLSRIVHKLAKILLPFEFSYHRASLFLLWKTLRTPADLYIGHDLTSLSIVVRAAKYRGAKSGFDAEDFHRNESTDDPKSYFYRASKAIEDRYLLNVDQVSCASPLIFESYQQLYPKLRASVLLNTFSKQYLPSQTIKESNGILRLFWFSQTIGSGRGLETVIAAIGQSRRKDIVLSLLGDVSPTTKSYFERLAEENNIKQQVFFLNPVGLDELFGVAKEHDVGLALEINRPYNRDICLTNKIFTYLTAGLAVIASETKAQKLLLKEYPNIGTTINIGDSISLSTILISYLEDPTLLNNHKLAARALANDVFNSETTYASFVDSVKELIN